MQKLDPLKGMNPDQSGPIEKIQNGDPKSSPDRDQRSGAAESGGPGGSLQQAPTDGQQAGQVQPQEGLEVVNRSEDLGGLDKSSQEPEGAHDRAGHASYQDGKLKDATDGPQGKQHTKVPEGADKEG